MSALPEFRDPRARIQAAAGAERRRLELPAALESVATRSPVPVEVRATLDGRLDVVSPPGAGTRLRVEVPCPPPS